MDFIIDIYWFFGIGAIFVFLMIYYMEILPLLKKHNELNLLSIFTNLRHGKDIERYKEISIKNQRALFWFNFLINWKIFILIYIAGWFVLIICAEILT
ncbi:MAG: hypothetical protein GY699_19870 [Desulfobacteraceae bacterium]|nr:hypothetical protein [Desulfobacteraceae bacterium]